jgi:hypothetical protein
MRCASPLRSKFYSGMLRTMKMLFGTGVVSILLINIPGSPECLAADVYGKRLDPPHIYFVHSSICKSGVTSGIKGQENFLELFITSVADDTGKYTPENFSYEVLLPAYLKFAGVTHRFPDNGITTIYEDDPRLAVTETVWQGKPYWKVEKSIDAERAKVRFFDQSSSGANVDTLWYRTDADQEVPDETQPIQVTLFHKGRACHTDTSELKIYEALETPPKISPRDFLLWLYRGPRWRNGAWDELGDSLAKAGINAIQYGIDSPSHPTGVDPAQDECIKEMRKRGFYIIVSTGGGYAFGDSPRSIYKAVERGLGKYEDDPVSMGPRWFEDADKGAMERYAPMADAALWNFEPGARVSLASLDPWNTGQFKELFGIPADEELNLVVDIRDLGKTDNWVTTEAIEPEKIERWMGHRRELISLVIKNWADFVRGINPDIETIITEGNMGVKPGSGRDLGYENFGDYVTYCQPMRFSGPVALRKMTSYMKQAPNAQFLGCQNVSHGSYGRVVVPAEEIMLQVLGAALIGCKGTGLYAGLSMDAENFVLLNRAMGFLGRNQDLIFEGTPDPANLALEVVTREDPDQARDLISRAYRGNRQDEYLVVVGNYNQEKPCYLKLTISAPDGNWFIVDEESKQVLVSEGTAQISSDVLGQGVYLECPAYDFRGYRLMPASKAIEKKIEGYERIDAQAIKQSGT